MGELTVGIEDQNGGGKATVTKRGELVVAPLAFSEPYYVQVAVLGTPYEIVPASGNESFVITGLLIASSKNYGSATVAETLTIYEANAADLSTSLKTIFRVDLLRNDRVAVTGLNIITTAARTLVAIADSAEVDVTFSGYYVEA